MTALSDRGDHYRGDQRGERASAMGLLNRRGFAGGLAAFGAFAALPALAQAPDLGGVQTPPTTGSRLPTVEDEAALLANLFTRMSTKTTINGRPGFSLVLDTGAGSSAIAEDLAVALALPPGPQVVVHGVTSAQIASTVKIARLAFGGRRFNDVQAAVFPREMLGADGLLGLDVLSGFELSFDMIRRTMLLTPSSANTIEFGRAFGTSSRIPRGENGRTRTGRFGQLILLNARADGVPVECFVDSGAQSSIGNMALYTALGGHEGPTIQRVMTQVFGVTGQVLMAERGGVGNLEINRQRLGPTPLLFADLHAFKALDMIERPALLIGGDILYRFREVSLDFGRSRMAFTGLRRPLTTATRL